MPEQPDVAELAERVSRMGAAVAERRSELSQTRERIERLRLLVDQATEVELPADAPAASPPVDSAVLELHALLTEREVRLKTARRELGRLEADLAQTTDRLDHAREARRRESARSEQRIRAAEGEVTALSAQLDQLRQEVDDAHEQLARKQLELDEFEQHVRTADDRIRAMEYSRDDAQRRYEASRRAHADAVAAQADALQQRDEAQRAAELAREIAEAAATAADAAVGAADANRERADRLEVRLQAAHAELRRAEQLLSTRTDELAAARRELDRARRGAAAVPRWAAVAVRPPTPTLQPGRRFGTEPARVRELEQQLSLLVHGLATTRADLERVRASSAWRFGHALATASMRLRGRRPKTRGAVAAALERISRLEEAHLALNGSELRVGDPARVAPPEPPSIPTALLAPGSRDRNPGERDALAAEIRRRLGAVPGLRESPRVSIVVWSRKGGQGLDALVDGLAHATDYPHVELIVVDGDPTGDSVANLQSLDPGFPLRVLARDDDVSSSEARNHGAAAATGELLLFLEDDVEPFEAGWLSELVAVLLREDVVACGATLLYAQDRQDVERHGWLIEHRGIRFRYEGHELRAFNADDGSELFDEAFGTEQRCPALSAACLLVERKAFERVGGFGVGYHDGAEELDLGLKLARTGRWLIATGRAVVFHQHSATKSQLSDELGLVHRRSNLTLFHERWGPEARRAVRIGVLDADPCWGGGRAPHIAITESVDDGEGRGANRPTAHELGDALAGLGWRVSYLEPQDGGSYRQPPEVDYVLMTTDSFDARHVAPDVKVIAWIHDSTERWLGRPWFGRIDVVLASSHQLAQLIEELSGRAAIPFPLGTGPVTDIDSCGVRAQELVQILREREQMLSFCIKIGAPSWEAAERWGDLYFARALDAELTRRGHPCRIQVLDEWENLDGLGDDVAIHLKGRGRYRPKPGQLNVLWSISHPQDLSGEECDIYDLICVASAGFADQLREQTRTPVQVLEQATDPRVFYPDRDASFAHELVFVGNSRNVVRRIVRDLVPTKHDLAVYGGNWDGLIESRLVVAEFVPNDQLRKVYSSAAIVLADHWDDMRDHGYVSNRIFDALACGAFVISDDVAGLEKRFGGGVVTYSTRDELHELVERMLHSHDERVARGAAGREIVLAEHTFTHRVDALLASLGQLRGSVATYSEQTRV